MTTAHPEYAERLDITEFRDDDYGHRPDCPMLMAYDNDGCDCAMSLLTEVRRLLAINSGLVNNYNDLLIRNKVALASIGLTQVDGALIGGKSVYHLDTKSLIL